MTSSARISPAPLPEICLVGSRHGATTGLSRYARYLHLELSKRDVPLTEIGAGGPPLPAALIARARRAGFDLEAFFRTYPISMGKHSPRAIVHITSQNQASAVAFRRLPKLVVTVHDVITSAYRHEPELTGYMRFYDRLFDTLAVCGLRGATRIIAASEHTRRDIIKHMGLPGDKVTTVPMAVDHQVFRPSSENPGVLHRYNLDPGLRYILYVGSEDPRKNLTRLLQAFHQISQRLPDVRLLKVGGARFAKEHERLMATVSRMGLDGLVHFFDQVSETDLKEFFQSASLFVFPSLHEGFGLPAVEAMACGTPVVAASASSLPEVIGDAGLFFDPHDVGAMASAIERVLIDNDLRERLRASGLAQAAKFTWERTARETVSVYERAATDE